jgi:hypothetical protein
MEWSIAQLVPARIRNVEPKPPANAEMVYALEQVRRKGYLPQADNIDHVGPFDRLVLTAIDYLRGRGDTAKIIAKAEKLSRTRVLL